MMSLEFNLSSRLLYPCEGGNASTYKLIEPIRRSGRIFHLNKVDRVLVSNYVYDTVAKEVIIPYKTYPLVCISPEGSGELKRLIADRKPDVIFVTGLYIDREIFFSLREIMSEFRMEVLLVADAIGALTETSSMDAYEGLQLRGAGCVETNQLNQSIEHERELYRWMKTDFKHS